MKILSNEEKRLGKGRMRGTCKSTSRGQWKLGRELSVKLYYVAPCYVYVIFFFFLIQNPIGKIVFQKRKCRKIYNYSIYLLLVSKVYARMKFVVKCQKSDYYFHVPQLRLLVTLLKVFRLWNIIFSYIQYNYFFDWETITFKTSYFPNLCCISSNLLY